MYPTRQGCQILHKTTAQRWRSIRSKTAKCKFVDITTPPGYEMIYRLLNTRVCNKHWLSLFVQFLLVVWIFEHIFFSTHLTTVSWENCGKTCSFKENWQSNVKMPKIPKCSLAFVFKIPHASTISKTLNSVFSTFKCQYGNSASRLYCEKVYNYWLPYNRHEGLTFLKMSKCSTNSSMVAHNVHEYEILMNMKNIN